MYIIRPVSSNDLAYFDASHLKWVNSFRLKLTNLVMFDSLHIVFLTFWTRAFLYLFCWFRQIAFQFEISKFILILINSLDSAPLTLYQYFLSYFIQILCISFDRFSLLISLVSTYSDSIWNNSFKFGLARFLGWVQLDIHRYLIFPIIITEYIIQSLFSINFNFSTHSISNSNESIYSDLNRL